VRQTLAGGRRRDDSSRLEVEVDHLGQNGGFLIISEIGMNRIGLAITRQGRLIFSS